MVTAIATAILSLFRLLNQFTYWCFQGEHDKVYHSAVLGQHSTGQKPIGQYPGSNPPQGANKPGANTPGAIPSSGGGGVFQGTTSQLDNMSGNKKNPANQCWASRTSHHRLLYEDHSNEEEVTSGLGF